MHIASRVIALRWAVYIVAFVITGYSNFLGVDVLDLGRATKLDLWENQIVH